MDIYNTDENNTVVAIYKRVSSEEQAREGYSLDAQEKVLLDYCKLRGYTVYKIYADEGISAKDIKHRPGMLSLLSDARQKKFNTILVWKLTRFTRKLSDLTTVCDDLESYGVYLSSYTEAFDSKTPSGRMVRAMLGAVAQFDREVISENVKLGMEERARQGKRTCNEVVGYDIVDKDNLVINEKEAEYVRFVYDSYLKYKTISKVLVVCKERGFTGKRGKPPRHESIHRILTRPIYCGYNLFNGKLYKGAHPAIIPVSKYNRVQQIMMDRGVASGRPRLHALKLIP